MKALKVIFGIVVLAGAAALFFMTYYPERAQNVLIPDIEQVETAEISLEGDSLFATLGIRMKNEGLFRINIDSIDYDIHFDTIRVLNHAQDVAIALSPGDEDTFRLPVAVPLKKLLGRIRELQHRDSAYVKSDVRVIYNTVFGHNVLRHKKTNGMVMPVPPEMKIEKVAYQRIENKKVHLLVSLAFINRGNLTMQLENLRFSVRLADLAAVQGKLDKLVHILPGETTRESVPVAIDVLKPLKALFLAAADQDKVRYSAEAEAVVSSGKVLHNTRVFVTSEGEVELNK
jgi:LEA14-like dessication related protein